jgi:hypothetical protein
MQVFGDGVAKEKKNDSENEWGIRRVYCPKCIWGNATLAARPLRDVYLFYFTVLPNLRHTGLTSVAYSR